MCTQSASFSFSLSIQHLSGPPQLFRAIFIVSVCLKQEEITANQIGSELALTEIFGIKNEAWTLRFRGEVLGEEPLCVTRFGSEVINITDMPCVESQRHKTVSAWAAPADILHLKGQKWLFVWKTNELKEHLPLSVPLPFGVPCGHLFRVPLRLTLKLKYVQNTIVYCMRKRTRGFRPLINNDISVSWHSRMRNKGSCNLAASNANLPIKKKTYG